MYRVLTTFPGRNEELNEVMATALKQARIDRNVTQQGLAKLLKTTQSSISRAEKGNISSVRWWIKAIRACGSEIQFHISVESKQKNGETTGDIFDNDPDNLCASCGFAEWRHKNDGTHSCKTFIAKEQKG